MSCRNKLVTRREFIKVGLAGSAAVMGLPVASLCSQASNKSRPPNFVVILADDLGYGDLPFYNPASLISTPRLGRMASEGMKFTDFYSAAPVCTPARASLMTGCYPQRVSLPSVLGPDAKVGISDAEITIAELLRQQGYATACIGKWHLGHHPQFLPTRHGFDRYFGLPYSNDMDKPDNRVPLIRNEQILERPVVQETLTERYTDEAISFIKENKDKPFFLYLPHTFPHVPLHASDRFKGKSKGGLYGDVVECMDWSMGRILDTLKMLGLDENTLVIFTSDNGPWLIKGKDGGCATPLRDGKSTCWEGGQRVPCIMRWSGYITAGSVCSEVAAMMDIYPTIAGLAGVKLPEDRIIDGKDINCLLTGIPGEKRPRSTFFYYRRNELRAVRSGDWKLVVDNGDPKLKGKFQPALYDLKNDIAETTDLSAKQPAVVKRLLSMLEECRTDLGDTITGVKGKNVRPSGKA